MSQGGESHSTRVRRVHEGTDQAVNHRLFSGGTGPSRSSSKQSQTISLSILGGFELGVNGRVLALPKTARRLLAFLAFFESPVERLFAAHSLWINATEKHAEGNLRTALWRVSQVGCPMIVVSSGQLTLSPHLVVDYRLNLALARHILDNAGSLNEKDLNDVAFVQDLLPGWDEDWVLVERERYHQLRLHVLDALCSELVTRGRFGRAIQAGLAAVAAEPLRESANHALICAYVAEGNVCEAIRHYEYFSRLLWAELRVRPTSRTSKMIDALVNEC